MYKLHLTLNKSPTLFLILSVLHVAAIAALFLSTLAFWIIAIFIVLCAISLYAQYKKCLSMRSLDFDGDTWCLDKRFTELQLLPSSVIHPWLTILNFKQPQTWHTKSVIIVPGVLSTDTFRRLRMQFARF